jgi:DNA-directed RNA polymerase subunit M/transcription elongation factor TFIIS
MVKFDLMLYVFKATTIVKHTTFKSFSNLMDDNTQTSMVEDPRTSVVAMIKSKMPSLTDEQVKDLEIGVFNWCIEYSNDKKIIKNWKNPRYYKVYIEKVRSVLSNLDKEAYVSNTRLLQRLQENEFVPHEIPFMKSEETFPELWKETIDAYMKKYKNAYVQQDLPVTEMFRCSKCGKRKCTFYTMQTRSADEGETVFVNCLNCGKKFKIS